MVLRLKSKVLKAQYEDFKGKSKINTISKKRLKKKKRRRRRKIVKSKTRPGAKALAKILMKSTKYDMFYIKIDELLILESGHFPPVFSFYT